MKFSALVLTLNEERHIEACLHSLAAAREIVMMDCGSTDATVSIASRQAGVRVVTRPFVSFADQRNSGLASSFSSGEWVLHLDADERVTPELAAELAALSPSEGVVAFNIASRTLLGGQPVLRASGFPVYQTRLTRAGSFQFEDVGHGQKASASLGPLPRLRHPYDHYPFEKGPEEWRLRHERYAEKEAADLLAPSRTWSVREAVADPIARRQWLKHAGRRLPFRPTLAWLYLMLLRGGVLDGPAGWEYCALRRRYEGMVQDAVSRLRLRAD
jgi:glycosyltransferase involved in cell wall biosynthesis